MIGRLPSSVVVSGKEYILRTDYRNVLDAFTVFNDPDLTNAEKWFTVVYMMFEELPSYEALEEAIIDGFDIKEAMKGLQWFFSAGKQEQKTDVRKPPSFDWEQDEQMIFSAVNHVAGFEVRNADELHWWTFLSYFNEIGEGLFHTLSGSEKETKRKTTG